MENIPIKQEVKFLDSIKKWCCGIYCPTYEIWTGGYFHKDRERAIAEATKALKKSIAFKRELRKASDISDLIVQF